MMRLLFQMHNRKSKSAQVAMEFIVLIGVILFFFILFFFAIENSKTDKMKENRNNQVNEIALIVQDEIRFAAQSVDGYFREFNLPATVGSLEYQINITDDLVYVRTDDGKHAIALPVAEVTGEVNAGNNFVRKENGEVFLNE